MKRYFKVFSEKFKQQDIFGESFAQKLNGDNTVVQSYVGSVCTLMIFLVTILYALQKMDVIISKKDVDILSTVKEGFFDDDYVFSHENGLGIAVAFTGYNNEREWSLDPSYGNLVFNSFSWGVSDDGSYFTE